MNHTQINKVVRDYPGLHAASSLIYELNKLIPFKDDKYEWSIFGDSINLILDREVVAQIYLKTLNEEVLEVEVNAFLLDSVEMVFKRKEKAANKK